MIENRWLKVKELMVYLKIGKSRVYKLLQEGTIPASRIGKSWRIDREEVDSWMRSQRTIPTQADLESDLLMETEGLVPEKAPLASPTAHGKEEPGQITKGSLKH